MTNYITVIIAVVLLSFSGKAYCWSLNDIQNTVQQAASSVTKNASAGTSNNNTAQPQATQQQTAQSGQGEQQPATQDASPGYVNIEKGVYGIPFKADLATILKWCDDNKVDIQNSTKEQVEDKARDLLSKIKNIKNDYEDRKSSLSDAEKDVAAITSDPQIDAMEKEAAVQAQKLLGTLNNPSVNYAGKTYILNNELSDGIQVEVGGVQKFCTDKRITDSIFSLTVSPTDQSQNLINQSLSSIQIIFYKDESGVLLSYYTTATFNNTTEDGAFQKQYQTLTQVLSQKYGTPTQSSVNGNFEWRKNIFLQGGIGSNSFIVSYYEPGIYENLTTLQSKALEDFKNESANEDANKAKAMQNNF